MKKKALWTIGSLAVISLCLFACATSRAGYESAAYKVVGAPGDFELRDYPPLTVVTTVGPGQQADGAFMKLFRYIRGDNVTDTKIAMTTPVFMERGDNASTMSFVVPAEVANQGAPAPKAEKVSLAKRSAGRYAVFRFTGKQSAENEKTALAKLQNFLKEKSLTPSGPATFAYYDPPWTPSALRRNEVLLPIKANP